MLLPLLAGCAERNIDFSGSFEIDQPTDPEFVQARATAMIMSLGWDERRNQIYVSDGRSLLVQDWWRPRGAWFWRDYDSLTIQVDSRSGLVTVYVYLRDRDWRNRDIKHRAETFERMLDEYYNLRDQVVPEILDRASEELPVRTLFHPATMIPVEHLAQFDREPLDEVLQRRLAQWEAGEIPSTRERHRAERREFLRNFSLWYGLPALVGTLVLLLIWRFLVPHSELGVRGKRVLFVTLGFMVYAPVMIPMMGYTTYAASLIYPGPIVFFELIFVSIWTGAIVLLQLPTLLVLWLLSRWLIRPRSQA